MQSAIINTYETFREEDLDVCLNPQHERAKLKHFCNSPNCQSLLCPSCVVAEHRDPSNHELEDIEETFKKKKIKLGKDIKSLRRRISQVKSTMLNVQDSTLQDEKTEVLRNVDAIFNRGIKILENKRQKLVDRYNVACKQKESKDRSRKDSLDNFLKNATEYCNRSEQLINRNSMRSLLNVHQSVEAQLNMYLDMPVSDLTRGENDFEEKIEFDLSDLFDIKVENMEYASEKEDNELLIKLTKENKQNYLKNTISTFKKYNFKKVKIVFSYSMQSVLHVIALIWVLIKLPLNLIQLLNNDKKNNPNDTQLDAEKHNERLGGNTNQDVRQMNRDDLGHNERVDVWTHLELEKIRGYVIIFRDISWHIMMLLIIAMVIREITLIPLRMLEHGDPSEFEFDTRDAYQFACRSADNHTVATKPLEDMSCGSTGRLFKYGGVFANTTFPLEESSSIEFSIKFQLTALRSQNVQDNVEYTVFEFGLTNDSISKEFLYPSVFSVSAFTCPNSFGVCLKTDNGILLRGKAIFKSETNSLFYEGRFILAYQHSDFTVIIQAKFPKKNTTKELHRISFTKLTTPFRPVFAAYNSEKITVLMTIVTNQVGFDRNTLHPNLYISDNNKTMSNTKLNAIHSGNNLKMHLSNEFLNTMISIDFVESNSGDTLLKIGMRERNFELNRDRNKKVGPVGLREKEDVIFKTTEILELTKCNVTIFFGFYRTIGYCLSDKSNTNRIVVGDHINLFLYYNMYGLKLYILDNFSGYRYFNFYFNSNYMPWVVMGLPAGLGAKSYKPLKMILRGPEMYIEKVSAQDIVVASREIKNELYLENNPTLFLALLLGIVLIISKIIIDST
ncbi:Hypothetical predicted protein [Mytilus galloprovincialis]|uniref:B box-type domain-containing protein n=1 Tax=Mytilus galloprovincialis TaxID=29158 RepID=A0A8B6BHX4_MYTGA|nr:Hypothetical predicted protein [Mytilus galloprovincialis]